jgi:hypothetical protein
MAEKSLMRVTTRSGGSVLVDISDDACKEFQIANKQGKKIPTKNGVRVAHPDYPGGGTVIGVGKSRCSCPGCRKKISKLVLWVILDCDKGRASFLDSDSWLIE